MWKFECDTAWRTELEKRVELVKNTPDEHLGLVWCADSDKETRRAIEAHLVVWKFRRDMEWRTELAKRVELANKSDQTSAWGSSGVQRWAAAIRESDELLGLIWGVQMSCRWVFRCDTVCGGRSW